MKKIYWRPHKIARLELILIALMALIALALAERLRFEERLPHYEEKLAAAELTLRGMQTVRAERVKQGWKPHRKYDPARSGLIGLIVSPVTSNKGYITSKRTSVNPNFAALIVHLLKEAGVQEGDLVAVGFSGSFPALNIATLAAIDTLKLEPLIISSASASQWGANDPKMLWLDMERLLVERQIFKHRSIAASQGGIGDQGGGLSPEGLALLRESILKNHLRLIEAPTLVESIETRMSVYHKAANGRSIKAYINVGGGAASVGTHVGKKMYRPGLNLKAPLGAGRLDSVMNRFALSGAPVIHLSKIKNLAARWGLPKSPQKTPEIGEGLIYASRSYNRYLAGGLILILLGLFTAVIRTDWGYRLTRMARIKTNQEPPEQMI